MFCEKCGAQVNETDAFCGSCGNPVSGTTAKAPETMNDNVTPPVYAGQEYGNTMTPRSETSDYAAPATPVQNNYQSSNQQSSNYRQNNYREQMPADNPASDVPPSAYYEEPRYSPPPKPQSNKLLIITIIICSVVLLSLAAVFTYIMLNKDSDNKETNISSSTAEKIDNDEPVDEPEEPEAIVNEIDSVKIDSIISQNALNTDFGIYVKNLNNGYEFGYNENVVFPASAMCQVVILDALSTYAYEENIDPDYESVKFYYLEQNGKEAPDSKTDDDTYVYLSDYVEDIAMYGDNNKSNQIVDYLGGFDDINDYLDDNGYYNTRINRKIYTGQNSKYIDHSVDPNTTTAKDISLIYENLITNSAFGSESYMSNIFKSVNIKNEPIGLKKYIPPEYNVSSANAINSESTNDVAIISNGDTNVLVSIICKTHSDKVTNKSPENREAVQDLLINYILETQFE